MSGKPNPLSRSPLVVGETVCSRYDDCGRHVAVDDVSEIAGMREKRGERRKGFNGMLEYLTYNLHLCV